MKISEQPYIHYKDMMEIEYLQCKDEGLDVESLKRDSYKMSAEEAYVYGDKLIAAPMRKDYKFYESNDFEEIMKDFQPSELKKFSKEEILDKVKGAWAGRISGCLLGKPVETFPPHIMKSLCEKIQTYPLTGYMSVKNLTEADYEYYKSIGYEEIKNAVWIDTIHDYAEADDDTDYTCLALRVLEKNGRNFVSDDVLEAWLENMPYFAVCTAERVAYKNAAAGMLSPDTAFLRNPYREYIGAQIRSDLYGYINPGDPYAAAKMAWTDARISHVKNGIYGSMFVAALIAQAAVETDVEKLVSKALEVVPKTSRLYVAIKEIIEICKNTKDAKELLGKIEQAYPYADRNDAGMYLSVHTITNAVICTAAILFSKGDFSKAITFAVTCGYDTDCNGATVGSVLGMLQGYSAIDKKWLVWNDTLATRLVGQGMVTLDNLVKDTMKHCKFTAEK